MADNLRDTVSSAGCMLSEVREGLRCLSSVDISAAFCSFMDIDMAEPGLDIWNKNINN